MKACRALSYNRDCALAGNLETNAAGEEIVLIRVNEGSKYLS